MTVKSILTKACSGIKKGIMGVGSWIYGQFRSLGTVKGSLILLCKVSATRALDVLYFNGGKLYMTNLKTRCGKEVPIGEYKEHIEKCQHCIENKVLSGQLQDAERNIEKNIELSEKYVDASITTESLLKLALEVPKVGKKLQRLYNKYIPKLKEVKAIEAAVAGGIDAVEAVVVEGKSVFRKIGNAFKQIGIGIKKGLVGIKNAFKKLCHKTNNGSKKTKSIIYTIITFSLVYAIKVLTGISIFGLVADGINLLPGT